MEYSRNGVYTRVHDAVKAAFSDAYITSVYENVPGEFPTVFIREIGAVPNSRAVTFETDDDQYQSTFEVQVFCGKQMTAYSIMSIVQATMREMHYIQDMFQPIDNIDKTIIRLVARFHRVIGGGETMPS